MDRRGHFFASSESVTEGHPDKVCDQISDAFLDEILRQDPNGRVACETYITRGLVVIGGETTSRAVVDADALARGVLRDIGYTDISRGFSCDTCAVICTIGRQSPDIAQGVNAGGAGDQGLMVGYACRETEELMPLPIALAHRLTGRLAEVRKQNILPYLGPDGKAQVTVEYLNGRPLRISNVVVSAQHSESVLDSSGKRLSAKARREITEAVIRPSLNPRMLDERTEIFINPTGKFVIGGPQSDTGMTGRKIIVDTYGGRAPHGGGAFSGKDPTKVDRSGAYMARLAAKNIVAAGLAAECTVEIAYAIGVAEPVGLYVDTHGTGLIGPDQLVTSVRNFFDFTPQGIIKKLGLRRPVYRATAAYGHFGANTAGLPWESIELAPKLREYAAKSFRGKAVTTCKIT
ncbi:MAG: methionine adenosyltransferase [Elusimicrobiaceae bacterium]|nr:methionine adenosyltransferase [Elusimicrobiaceae bacterium]